VLSSLKHQRNDCTPANIEAAINHFLNAELDSAIQPVKVKFQRAKKNICFAY